MFEERSITVIGASGSDSSPSVGAEARRGERRLLLISYHFPPSREVGARRWQQLSKFASEWDWTVDVVTLDPANIAAPDWAALEELPAGVRVYSVAERTLPLDRLEQHVAGLRRRMQARRRADSGVGLVAGGTLRRGPETVDPQHLKWPFHSPRDALRAFRVWRDDARYSAWSRRAARLAQRLVEGCDYRAVITSGPPHLVHEVGWRLKRRTGLPFVMDMRDPWSLTPRLPEHLASPLWFQVARRRERRVVQSAALIVTNTEPSRLAMQAAYPAARGRIIAILNGYDDEPIPRSQHGPCFVIAYAGSIYLDRDPRPLLRAAARVIRGCGLAPDQLRLEFMGEDATYGGTTLEQLADKEGIKGFIHVHGARPRAEAMQFLARGTMLVSLPLFSRSGEIDATIPAKIFDYVRFDAWLLALAERGSATELLLRGTGADVVSPHDIEGIAAAVAARYSAYASGARPARPRLPDRFSRRAQAQSLFDEIERRLSMAPQASPR